MIIEQGAYEVNCKNCGKKYYFYQGWKFVIDEKDRQEFQKRSTQCGYCNSRDIAVRHCGPVESERIFEELELI